MTSDVPTAAEICKALSTEEAISALSFYGLTYWNKGVLELEKRLEGLQDKLLKGRVSPEEEKLISLEHELQETSKRLRRRLGELLENPEFTAFEKPLAIEFLTSQISKFRPEAGEDPKVQKRIEKLQDLLATVRARTPVQDSRKMVELKTELARIEKEDKDIAPRYEQWQKGRFAFQSNDELQTFQRRHREVQRALAAQREAVEMLRRRRGPEGGGGSGSAP
eukprot:CAMPEP_0179122914 /NCGR_PEP_ID=MMETSP0796-20121207/58028_1 /TAXON_ID=73915 /ORGANISM="Pyrodinium bahamense, Strain pbaha01" /LENGTH=221 /DNA_ID=CAMNT_0020821545 /DNA_START=34 /DNA_END=696 /DNA_ORIENTATION=-